MNIELFSVEFQIENFFLLTHVKNNNTYTFINYINIIARIYCTKYSVMFFKIHLDQQIGLCKNYTDDHQKLSSGFVKFKNKENHRTGERYYMHQQFTVFSS